LKTEEKPFFSSRGLQVSSMKKLKRLSIYAMVMLNHNGFNQKRSFGELRRLGVAEVKNPLLERLPSKAEFF